MRGASFGAEAWRLGALDALTGFAGVMAAEGASRPCLPPGPALAAGVLPPRRSAAVSPATARCGAAGDCGTPRLVPWRLRTVACVAGGKAESTAFFSDADDVRRAGVYLGRVWATGGLSLRGSACGPLASPAEHPGAAEEAQETDLLISSGPKLRRKSSCILDSSSPSSSMREHVSDMLR
mmetsp:Transcript_36697/g.87197  ORF Transcript_36697/g.87197 Transcript_36697/m.87197 type:complete len:180 (+) Transcript_36697:1537-2076(+)